MQNVRSVFLPAASPSVMPHQLAARSVEFFDTQYKSNSPGHLVLHLIEEQFVLTLLNVGGLSPNVHLSPVSPGDKDLATNVLDNASGSTH